jgi:hypothetical protein
LDESECRRDLDFQNGVDARAEQPIEQGGNSTMTGASIIGKLSERGIEGT